MVWGLGFRVKGLGFMNTSADSTLEVLRNFGILCTRQVRLPEIKHMFSAPLRFPGLNPKPSKISGLNPKP